MGQWYYVEYDKPGDYAYVYTFDRNENKRNNTIYIQSTAQLLYFTYWSKESKMGKEQVMNKLQITDFRQGVIHIAFSDFEQIDKLVYEIAEGDLASYMRIV